MRRLVAVFLVLMIVCSGAFAWGKSPVEMYQQGLSCFENGDYDNAMIWWQKAADNGNADAMVDLGSLYSDRGDYDNAMIWWQKAADNGDADAMVKLGILYYDRRDYDNARIWSRKAADKGHVNAAKSLAYLIGKQKISDALRNRYDKGDKEAGLELAYYLVGNEKYDEAFSIFTSLSRDFPAAAYWAGYCFEKQNDPTKAKYWYDKAESAGFVMPDKK